MLLLRVYGVRTIPNTLLSRSVQRCYSSASPLINITDLKAPSSGRIRILSLNRPEARNALSRSLLAEFRAQIDAVSNEYHADGSEAPPVSSKLLGGAAGPDGRGPTRALIITSDVDSCFCAGADLKERKGMSQDEYDLSS